MFKTKAQKLIVILILIAICCFLITTYQNPKKENQQNFSLSFQDSIQSKISVYNFMDQLQKDGKITFQSKNYPGMGEFITEINGVENGNGRYWIYYINGKKAEVGVSNYQINKGDTLSWKYEK